MEKSLYYKLVEYSRSNYYPLHMPGHKRQWGKMENPYSIDITEIDGFDDLHHPEGILLESEQMAARLYGTKASYYLINGSTAGIMTAISAVAKPHETILAASDCHRSVWNTAYLRNLKVDVLETEAPIEKKGKQRYPFSGPVCMEKLKREIEENPEIRAIVITSPTYEGIVSPIREIAHLVHQYGMNLVVDEAHGAHLPFAEKKDGTGNGFFPASAIEEGADIVIQSLHKTLPSLTQTAILHVCSERVDCREVEQFYSIYQTSSPSYILLSSIDTCVRYMENSGREQMKAYEKRLRQFWERTREWENLWFLYRDERDFLRLDPSKVVFGGYGRNSGIRLMKRFRDEFRLECEMCREDSVIAMTSLMDTEEGFTRLEHALDCINREEAFLCKKAGTPTETEIRQKKSTINRCRIDLSEARKEKWISLFEAEGKSAAQNIAVYPPGIPFVRVGEVITAETVRKILKYRKDGFRMDGVRYSKQKDRIEIAVEE